MSTGDGNPYAPPSPVSLADSPTRERVSVVSRHGSILRLGEPKHFTQSWQRLQTIYPFLWLTAVFGLMIVPSIVSDEVWVVLAFVLIAAMSWPMFWGNVPRFEAKFRSNPRPPGSTLVQVTFSPRVLAWASKAGETADDIGELWIERGRLRFRGDWIELDLKRDDVDGYRTKSSLGWFFCLGPDACLDFVEQLHDCVGIQIHTREGSNLFRLVRTGVRVRRQLSHWVSSTSGGD